MNGSATSTAANDSANSLNLSQITQALNAIHDPRSSNQVRKDATIYLEQAKTLPNAPSIGFELANTRDHADLARHYGLSLLEYSIRYGWDSLQRQDSQALRQWIVQLAHNVDAQDPQFLRNKIAQIWLELAKKCWLDEWEDMDAQLVALWNKTYPHQALVLQVLEFLSEDAFDNDDVSVYLKGGGQLRRACIETFTAADVLVTEYPDRTMGSSQLRCGQEGWFLRLLDRLRWCLDNLSDSQPDVLACTITLLNTLRSMMPWMFLKALHGSDCVNLVCRALPLPDMSLQLSALEVMHSIYHRKLSDEDVRELVYPLLAPQGVELLRSLYDFMQVDVDDIDDQKYLCCKKLTEVMCALGCFIEQRPHLMAAPVDVAASLDLFVHTLKNPSLVVTIPIIYLWDQILNCRYESISSQVEGHIAILLEISSQRLLRYESLPSESDDITYRFLNEDFDTTPERHAFVGNYRRFCSEIVERVVRKSPFEAMRHILSQADQLFSSIPGADKPMNSTSRTPSAELSQLLLTNAVGEDYSSSSFAILRVDAQCTVTSSAVKGYQNWLAVQKSKGLRHVSDIVDDDHQPLTSYIDPSQEASHDQLQNDIEQWCSTLLGRDFSDPLIQKRILQLISELTNNVLKPESSLPLAICEHALSKASSRTSDSTKYGDAVKEMQASLPRTLHKLAMRYCDAFMNVYPQLETAVNETASSGILEPRTATEYKAILLIIVHRTKLLEPDEKRARIGAMLEPILTAWRDPAITKGVQSFDGFCDLIGLAEFPSYFLAAQASTLEDWSTKKLDEQGYAMRNTITARADSLPLQPLKCFLTVSTDRIQQNTPNFSVAESIWATAIPVVLPSLLQILSQAHAFSSPESWSSLPGEMQDVIRRLLVDRVWQSGISTESKDDFFERVRRSRETLEGLASAIRAAVRGIRDFAYWILHCLCQFSDAFFQHADLATPLARALYENAHSLSPHQVGTLLRISTALLDACPPQYQDTFLPPLLSNLFTQVDRKLTQEWDDLSKRAESSLPDEGLDLEMKTESIVRQLTHSAVMLASSLLNPQGPQLPTSKRSLVLSNSEVLSSLVLFATHALRMRDTRSCSHIVRALRAIIPDFNPDVAPPSEPSTSNGDPAASASAPARPDPATAAQIREFFGRDILQNAITSLHEPAFADAHKDLAALIAGILVHYAHATDTPRAVLLSLPGMTAAGVDASLSAIRLARSERQMRGEVLRLLEGLRGISIHEMGRMRGANSGDDSARRRAARPKTRMQEQYAGEGAMDEDAAAAQIRRGGSAEVDGVGSLFG